MLANLNKNLGIILFKNPNTFNYILFNKFYSLFILKKKFANGEILEFHKKGFVKTKYESQELVKFVNEKIISPQEKYITNGVPRHQFIVNEHYREKILKLIKRDYGELIEKLEKYYNNKIAISEFQIKIFRFKKTMNIMTNKLETKQKNLTAIIIMLIFMLVHILKCLLIFMMFLMRMVL